MSDFIQERKYKSLLEELIDYYPKQDTVKLIDSKAEHIYESAINLFQMIRSELSEQDSDELLKYFMLAIKCNDYTRFRKKINKIFNKDKNDDTSKN